MWITATSATAASSATSTAASVTASAAATSTATAVRLVTTSAALALALGSVLLDLGRLFLARRAFVRLHVTRQLEQSSIFRATARPSEFCLPRRRLRVEERALKFLVGEDGCSTRERSSVAVQPLQFGLKDLHGHGSWSPNASQRRKMVAAVSWFKERGEVLGDELRGVVAVRHRRFRLPKKASAMAVESLRHQIGVRINIVVVVIAEFLLQTQDVHGDLRGCRVRWKPVPPLLMFLTVVVLRAKASIDVEGVEVLEADGELERRVVVGCHGGFSFFVVGKGALSSDQNAVTLSVVIVSFSTWVT